MKTKEQEIFDELMRQKLGGYSEDPEMDLLGNIHAKKDRLIKLYGLYKMFAIVCVVGLGMLSAYMLLQPEAQLSSANHNTNNNAADKVYTSPVADQNNYFSTKNVYAKTTSSSVTSTASGDDHVVNTVFSDNSSVYNTEKTLNNKEQVRSRTTNNTVNYKNNSTSQKTITSPKAIIANPVTPKTNNPDNNLNTGKNKNSKTSDEPEVKKEGEPKDEKTPSEKDKNTSSSECKAAFDYYVSYDGKFNFTNFSQANPDAQLTWNFGDGTQSTVNDPVHTYSQKGTYIVTLHVADASGSCDASFQKTIAYDISHDQQNKGLSIKGRVIGSSEPVPNGRVKLLSYTKESNTFVLLSKSTTSLSGEYSFDHLKPGRYLILAEGNNNSFIPTYWGNTTSPEEAIEVAIMENDDQDMLGYNISLSGNKSLDAGNYAQIPSGDSSGDQTVMILDQNNNYVSTAKVDKNGNVNLGGLPPGDYKILNTNTGATSKMTVKNNGAASSANQPASGAGVNNSITLVPNPAVNNFKFDINASSEAVADITIINSSGSTVYHSNYLCNGGENPMDVNIYNLPPGVYYVVVNVGGKQTMSGRLIKKSDDSTK